jgi:hypothetical protein
MRCLVDACALANGAKTSWLPVFIFFGLQHITQLPASSLLELLET